MDQAFELRRLMLTGRADTRGALPRTFVVAGGKPGVGATTLAVNLAAALAHDAQRVVLVDADLYQADAGDECGASATFTIGDVLAGRKNIHEALVRGPAGMQVLAGAASPEVRAGTSARSVKRLLRQLQSVAPHADWLIIDAGNQADDLSARLWGAAQQVLLVTSPDAAAVMDSYALIKTLLKRQSLQAPLALVVNRAADEAEAGDVCRRIDQSCRRFLGLSVPLAGWLPYDTGLPPLGERDLPAASLAAAVDRVAAFAARTQAAGLAPQRMAA